MPKKNGFCMFMESRRASVVAEGVELTRGRKTLADYVSDEWKVLPQDEKDKFIKMAERYNEQNKGKQTGPGGVPFKVQTGGGPTPQEEVEDETPERYLKRQTANDEVISELFETDGWQAQPIVVCHFTTYFQPDYGQSWIPAEIGLATFSLNKGVYDNFGRIIDTGAPPKGYGVDVANNVKVLGIPHPGLDSEFANYESLMITLESYLEKHRGGLITGEFIVFALDSEMQKVAGCFEWLNKNTGFKCPVRVLSLSLYAHLASTDNQKNLRGGGMGVMKEENLRISTATISEYRKTGKPLNDCFCYPSSHPLTKYGWFVTRDKVDTVIGNSDNYKYYDELCCVYHFKTGEQIYNCALNAANRYAYNILEILTVSNEVEIILGGHYPQVEQRRLEVDRRHGWLMKWGLTRREIEMDYSPETEVTVTQVQPLPDRRINDSRERQFDGSERRVLGEIDPEHDSYEEEEGAQSHRRLGYTAYKWLARGDSKSRAQDSKTHESQEGGRRQVAGKPNPYHGTVPSVYQGIANTNHSAETDEARGGK